MLPKKISTFKKLSKLNNIKVYCLFQVNFLIDSVTYRLTTLISFIVTSHYSHVLSVCSFC